jgi:hypothetical protein
MENNFEKIANIQLHFSNNCSEENKKILELYWEMESKDFKNPPSLVRKEFNITQGELNKLNATNAALSLYLLCNNCCSYEKHITTSQSAYKNILSTHRNRYSHPFNCDHCKKEHQKNLQLEFIRKEKELSEQLNTAIDNKNWENLTNFEKGILGNCLEMNFNQLKHHYGRLLGQGNFYKLIRALEAIENQYLIKLNREPYNHYIKNYHIENRLREYKEKIVLVDKVPESSVEFNTETNELKFKLTINENQQHPDQPTHAGTVTFKERIVIKPGVEYIFGQWQRANNSLYLTMMPIDKLKKTANQKRIYKQPIPIRKGITDFLNNMGEEYPF